MPSQPSMAPLRPLAEMAAAETLSRGMQPMDEQKRWFLRMTSHELRTPLNSIIGFSEILAGERAQTLSTAQSREYAAHILASGHKLLRLVNQLIEIGRLQNTPTDLHLASQPLDHVIDDVTDNLAGEIAERGARLTVENQGSLPCVLADPEAIRTVVNNLIHNAVTFAPMGGEVRVRAAVRGGKVELEIEDDGPGVEAAEIPRLLRPFEQGENAINRSTGGAGLGLAIVKALTRAMRGTLRLVCEPGAGLKAVVALPAA